MALSNDTLHHIVIVGGGAGGLELATHLGNKLGKRKKADVTLLDLNRTHIWKPLLHEVAAGTFDSYENQVEYIAQAIIKVVVFCLGDVFHLVLVRIKRPGRHFMQ